MNPPWQAVLDFWFLPLNDPGHLRPRPEWFRKDVEFDRSIREQFLALIEQALAGELLAWHAHAQGALACLILLDQFPRNIWRDTARAFAGDPQALTLALDMIDKGMDRGLTSSERLFVYLPLMHAEDLALQQQCVDLFRELAEHYPEQQEALAYAIRHYDIIARFGRFPHRNQQLARTSTPEEAQFLTEPNSSF